MVKKGTFFLRFASRKGPTGMCVSQIWRGFSCSFRKWCVVAGSELLVQSPLKRSMTEAFLGAFSPGMGFAAVALVSLPFFSLLPCGRFSTVKCALGGVGAIYLSSEERWVLVCVCVNGCV